MIGAYLHCRPNGVPFYVGKGTDKRSKLMSGRNNYHTNIVKKYGKDNILVGYLECSSEDIAFELEKGLIKCCKNMNLPIANMTDGGEGISGFKMPEYEIQRRKAAVPHNLGKSFSEATKKKMSQAKIGKKSWNAGRAWTAEEKQALSEAAKHRKTARIRNEKGQYQ